MVKETGNESWQKSNVKTMFLEVMLLLFGSHMTQWDVSLVS